MAQLKLRSYAQILCLFSGLLKLLILTKYTKILIYPFNFILYQFHDKYYIIMEYMQIKTHCMVRQISIIISRDNGCFLKQINNYTSTI